MLEFAVRQAGRLAVGLMGAAMAAAVISAIAEPHAPGLLPFLSAALSRLVHFLELDLGSSDTGLPAATELGRRLPPTLLLVLGGGAVALVVGVPLGLLFGVGPARRLAAPLFQIVTAAPVFCASLALAYGAGHLLNWPLSVSLPTGAPLLSPNAFKIEALPILTVGLAGAAAVQLALRRAASLSNGAAFRTGLRRLGLGAFEIERLYVVPQVLAGLVASAGEIMLALLSAAVVAEWVFHRPGAADLFVKSVALHDWNMTALVLFSFAGLTFVTDFLGRTAGFFLANEGRI
jgi:peptide/nickel transport system permease protein